MIRKYLTDLTDLTSVVPNYGFRVACSTYCTVFCCTPPPLPSFWTVCLVFAVALQVFAVELFGIRRWKANEKKNLMTISEIKIEHLQPKKSPNMFERIQKIKSRAIIFDFLFSFHHYFASFCSRII